MAPGEGRKGAQKLLERLGRAALIALLSVLLFSFMAYAAESPVNPEFSSYPTSLWWGYVTLTTVGYGDIVPITLYGRIAGVLLMTLGIGLLGVLAGSLAAFFKISPGKKSKKKASSADTEEKTKNERKKEELAALRDEVSELRSEIRRLSDVISATTDSSAGPTSRPDS